MIIVAQIPAGFVAIREGLKFDLKTRFHCAQKCNPRIFTATPGNM